MEKQGKDKLAKKIKEPEAKKTLGKRKHEESEDSDGVKLSRGRPRRVVAK